MIAAWKKEAGESWRRFSSKAEAVRATSVGELAKLLTKFGQLVIEKDFLSKVFCR
jgi:hypothetical protein